MHPIIDITTHDEGDVDHSRAHNGHSGRRRRPCTIAEIKSINFSEVESQPEKSRERKLPLLHHKRRAHLCSSELHWHLASAKSKYSPPSLIGGEEEVFTVTVSVDDEIGDLKKLIKKEREQTIVHSVDPNILALWKVRGLKASVSVATDAGYDFAGRVRSQLS